MKKIVITFKVDEEQKNLINSIFQDIAKTEFLRDSGKEESDRVLKDADILLAWNPHRELKHIKKDSLHNIEFVQLLSAGFDHIDFNRFPADCKIASNKGAYAEPMAEHILAMILAIYKNLFENHKKLSSGEFNQRGVNRSLKDQTCGILGYGGIGKAAADLLKTFGTKIYAINTSGKTDDEVDFIGTLNDLKYVFTNSDIVVISLPLTKETDGLIDKTKLELMKPNAVLINVARVTASRQHHHELACDLRTARVVICQPSQPLRRTGVVALLGCYVGERLQRISEQAGQPLALGADPAFELRRIAHVYAAEQRSLIQLYGRFGLAALDALAEPNHIAAQSLEVESHFLGPATENDVGA